MGVLEIVLSSTPGVSVAVGAFIRQISRFSKFGDRIAALEKQVMDIHKTIQGLQELHESLDQLNADIKAVRDRSRGLGQLRENVGKISTDQQVFQSRLVSCEKGLEELNQGFDAYMREQVEKWQKIIEKIAEMGGTLIAIRESMRKTSSGTMPKVSG